MIEPLAGAPSVVVVVPTYNERPNLEALAQGVLGLGDHYQLLVVDGSQLVGALGIHDLLAARVV